MENVYMNPLVVSKPLELDYLYDHKDLKPHLTKDSDEVLKHRGGEASEIELSRHTSILAIF